jgi:hypothetical protein
MTDDHVTDTDAYRRGSRAGVTSVHWETATVQALAAPRFDVALYCLDHTAMVYHVPTYAELVQSLVDISPIAGTYVCGVAVVRDGRQLSETFVSRALRATGMARVIALETGLDPSWLAPHGEQGGQD